ncbi:RdgB/HAM1 family non-canonical purine NTP pyrophosphatase [Radicibacter daui]|uniref:RdgB/HAM1 family non-canonical purine NTP pyrophosphatase n=1 Tax=Radicibacter daui TaxID=3064829 RepID=UPI0040468C1E
MLRRFEGNEIVIASFNKGKSKELHALLATRVPRIVYAGDLGVSEPDETGSSFIANAEIKALNCARHTGKISISDDSGLSVAALNGAPGIFSARWAGPDKSFTGAMARILGELQGKADRSAVFVSALTIAWPDGHTESVEGTVHGTIADSVRGNNGFGYDPIFIPKSYKMTFGEMEQRDKDAISHRADAWRKLVARCFV